MISTNVSQSWQLTDEAVQADPKASFNSIFQCAHSAKFSVSQLVHFQCSVVHEARVQHSHYNFAQIRLPLLLDIIESLVLYLERLWMCILGYSLHLRQFSTWRCAHSHSCGC